MSIETITPQEPSGEDLTDLDAVLDNVTTYPGEEGTDVGLRIALAMAGLSERNRTRPLEEILAEDQGHSRGVGETTYAAMLAIAETHGAFEPQPYIPKQTPLA